MSVTRALIFLFKVLSHRPLFRNYYSSVMKYALIKFGLVKNTNIIIKCLNGMEINADLNIFEPIIHLYVDNIITNIDCLSGIITTINGSLVPINELTYDGFEALRRGWNYILNGKYWLKDSIKFRRIYWPIIETFNLGEYSAINVNDRIVVDVGAFVGDSAIYFVLRGARRVYAIEPHPGAYAEMIENIKLNNMEDKIIPINAALGSKPGKIKIPNIDINTTAGTYHNFRNIGDIEIPMITLKQLINDYNIEPDILKMDCEGCEYDIILNDYEHVRSFNELVLEYHSYFSNHNVLELIRFLKQDFKCKFINEEIYKKYYKIYTKSELGMLHCVRT